MSFHPPGSVKLLQTPEVTWLKIVKEGERKTRDNWKLTKRQKDKALLFWMVMMRNTKMEGKASERIRLAGCKGIKDALFPLLDHVLKDFKIFLNSWPSWVINWKWNGNLKGLFLRRFHSQHGSVPPFTGKEGSATLFGSEFPLQLPQTLSNTSHTNTHTECTSVLLHASWWVCTCAVCTGLQKSHVLCERQRKSSPFHAY